jgi:two-component system, cell cycle sensor histidine kinase and response regulator CckA
MSWYGTSVHLGGMFENNLHPMWVYDIETFEFLAVNDAAVQKYGYSHEEFAQLTLRDIGPEAEVPTMVPDLLPARGLQRDEPWRHIRRDGSIIFVDIILAYPLEFSGRKARVVLAIEATERVQTMQALRETSDQLRTMVDTAPLAIWTLDRKGQITSWNRMAMEMFQWGADEVLGKQIEIIPEEKKAEFATLLSRYRSGDRVTAFETSRLRRDGSRIPVTLWSAPLADHANRQIGTLMIATDISQKKRDEETLARTEAGFRLLFENNPQPMWVFHAETLRFLEVNQAAIAHYGYSREEFLGMRASDIRTPEEAERFERALRTSPAKTPTNVGTWKHVLKSGKTVDIEIVAHELEFKGAPAILSVLTDVTDKRVLEEQLRQSQKLEAIGRLAGGVAHDFNNLLTVIIGYADLLRTSIAKVSPDPDAIDEIRNASDRAASLTRQLLAFSRKQVLEPTSLNLNQLVLKIQKMLSRLIGENIEIVTDLATELWNVAADPGQVDQIIMNLAVNARDAMDHGGTLTIQTRNVFLGDEYATSHSGAAQGANVLLSITDTGCGMNAETQSHIFEPFYTTKGRGTGLGLATVYGIVKQSGGDIWVYSEPGLGTCIKVYLPRLAGDIIETEAAPTPAGSRGTGCILLVEDEESLRRLIANVLEAGGYKVLAATTVEEAIKICADPLTAFDLLLTDIVLPGGNGGELATRATGMRPKLRTLLMSGYSEGTVLRQPPFKSPTNFIQKPFNADALKSKIREILDGPGR